MINKNSPIPIYYQIEEEIQSMIESGILKSGDLLPSEREIAEKYNISRMTVRQAINNLVNKGLIYRKRGKGSFITGKKLEHDLSGLTSFTEDMAQHGKKPSNLIISIKTITDDAFISSKLKTDIKDEIYKFKRLRKADDEPIALETVFTPKKLVGTLNHSDILVSFYQFLEKKLNMKIDYGKQTIEASLANQEEIKYLNIKKGDPILLMRRISFLKDKKNTPIEYVKSAYRADKYKFNMKIKRK